MEYRCKYNFGDRIMFQNVPEINRTSYIPDSYSPLSIEGQSGLIVGRGMGDYAVLFDRKMSNNYAIPIGGEDSFVTGLDPRSKKHNAKLFWFKGGIYEDYIVPEIKTALDLEEMI